MRSRQTKLGLALRSARGRVFGELRLLVLDEDRKGKTPYALKPLASTVVANASDDEPASGAA